MTINTLSYFFHTKTFPIFGILSNISINQHCFNGMRMASLNLSCHVLNFTFWASSPVSRVCFSWSLKMRNGRPNSSNARDPTADILSFSFVQMSRCNSKMDDIPRFSTTMITSHEGALEKLLDEAFNRSGFFFVGGVQFLFQTKRNDYAPPVGLLGISREVVGVPLT